jgi:hypothetical protein
MCEYLGLTGAQKLEFQALLSMVESFPGLEFAWCLPPEVHVFRHRAECLLLSLGISPDVLEEEVRGRHPVEIRALLEKEQLEHDMPIRPEQQRLKRRVNKQ